MLLRPFALFLIFVAGLAGCTSEPAKQTTAPVAPPLPNNLTRTHLEYYPDASKRAKEQGRVVLKIHLDPSGAIDLPMQIDRESTDAGNRCLGGVLISGEDRAGRSAVGYRRSVASIDAA